MKQEEINESLILFIREEIGEFKRQINSTTQIEEDLGVTGDDAICLIRDIANRYDVDISELDFKKYFHPEPSFLNIYSKITPLTIGDIQNAIILGKLT